MAIRRPWSVRGGWAMTPAFSMPRFRVTVVVLGDLGRSPRMLYHARALADSGADVQLVGYEETELPPEIATDPRVTVHVLQAPAVARRHALSRPVFLLVASWNAVRGAASLLATLSATVQPGSAILVQNPPTIPALAVALAVARIRRARVVVDWHNLGWAMLALRLGSRHPVVRLARSGAPRTRTSACRAPSPPSSRAGGSARPPCSATGRARDSDRCLPRTGVG